MDTIKIDIAGDRQVGLRFDEFPDALYEDLRQEIDGITVELFAMIQALTPERTGALRSQERLRLFQDKTRITGYIDIAGSVGNDFAKAGALEWGAHRPAKVSAHQMRLDHYWATKLNEPEMVVVDAYTRSTNVMEHAFERGPLAEMTPQILARLNAVVEKSVAKANA